MKPVLMFLVLATVAGGLYFAWEPKPDAPVHRYSADNIFFLRQYVSVRTSKGIIGLVPGQEVWLDTKVQPITGCAAVTDGRATMTLVRDVLTHDIDEAATLQADDMQSQTLLQAGLAQAKQSTDLQERDAQAVMADAVNTQGALQASANTVGNYRTRLNDGPSPAGGWSYSGSGYYPALTRESVRRTAAGTVVAPSPVTVASVSNASYRTQSASGSAVLPAPGPRRFVALQGGQSQ